MKNMYKLAILETFSLLNIIIIHRHFDGITNIINSHFPTLSCTIRVENS